VRQLFPEHDRRITPQQLGPVRTRALSPRYDTKTRPVSNRVTHQ